MSITQRVPLMVDEQDIDLLLQALDALRKEVKSLGMRLPDVEDLERRISEAEDRLIERGTSNASQHK